MHGFLMRHLRATKHVGGKAHKLPMHHAHAPMWLCLCQNTFTPFHGRVESDNICICRLMAEIEFHDKALVLDSQFTCFVAALSPGKSVVQ